MGPIVKSEAGDYYVCDASLLGWAPGHWPFTSELTVDNKQSLFFRSNAWYDPKSDDLEYVWYKNEDGVKVKVFND